MRDAIKYGGLTPAAAIAGWAWAKMTTPPTPLLIYGGVAVAVALTSWSLFWIGRDLHGWLSPQLLWAWHVRRLPPRLCLSFESPWPIHRLIPLRVAAQRTYVVLSKSAITRQSESLSQLGLGRYAETVAGAGDVHVYGIRPSFGVLEHIPKSKVEVCGFSDNGSEMFDQFSRDITHTGIMIRHRDFKRKLRELTKIHREADEELEANKP